MAQKQQKEIDSKFDAMMAKIDARAKIPRKHEGGRRELDTPRRGASPGTARTPKTPIGKLSTKSLKSLAATMGYPREAVTKPLTPEEAAREFENQVNAAQTRTALAARGTDNRGNVITKLTALFKYELD